MKRKFEIGDTVLPSDRVSKCILRLWLSKYSPLGVGMIRYADYNKYKRLLYFASIKKGTGGVYFYSWELNLVCKHEQI